MKSFHRSSAVFVIATVTSSWLIWFLAAGPANLIMDVKLRGTHFSLSLKTLLLWLGVCAPGIIAIILILKSGGYQAIKEFLRYSFVRKESLRPSVFALLIAAIAVFPSLFMFVPDISVSNLGWRFPAETALNLPLGPLWEEIGWRGYLFPLVQKSLGTMRSCLLVGIIWGLWHIPIRFSSGPPQTSRVAYLALFCASVCASSFVSGWLYNRARGGLLPNIVFHSALNSLTSEVVLKNVGLATLFADTITIGVLAILLHRYFPQSPAHRDYQAMQSLEERPKPD